MTIDVQRAALLIIDVQTGIFTIPGFTLHEPDAVLARISQLIDRARRSSVPVIFVQHDGAAGSAVEAGTAGAQIHSSITPLDGEVVVHKVESDAFLRTALQSELEKLGVTTLFVCGMQSEYCVDTTCRRAHGLDYRVYLVEDAHTTGGAGSLSGEQIVRHHNETLGDAFVTLCTTANLFT